MLTTLIYSQQDKYQHKEAAQVQDPRLQLLISTRRISFKRLLGVLCSPVIPLNLAPENDIVLISCYLVREVCRKRLTNEIRAF